MIKNRTSKVHILLGQNRLDGLLFLHRPNLRFLCGFSGTEGALLIGQDETVFLADSRYIAQAQREVTADRIDEYRIQLQGIVNQVRAAGWRRIGFEAGTIPYALVERLREEGGSELEWQPLSNELRTLRCLKDATEIKAMERAAQLAAEAFDEILPMIRPGAVERDISLALEFAMKRRGAEEKSFDFIVASGERGALPHGVASQKQINSGELVTIDFGARWEGYHSDETVTLAVGAVDPELRKIYDIVLDAHDQAIAQVRPGVPLSQIDGIARDHITAHGYGEFFGHGLGHGVGLEVHEFPPVSSRSQEVAGEDMVITIEPGIYIPGLGGVRIEDMVLVTAGGCRRLTRLDKEFRLLPG